MKTLFFSSPLCNFAKAMRDGRNWSINWLKKKIRDLFRKNISSIIHQKKKREGRRVSSYMTEEVNFFPAIFCFLSDFNNVKIPLFYSCFWLIQLGTLESFLFSLLPFNREFNWIFFFSYVQTHKFISPHVVIWKWIVCGCNFIGLWITHTNF